MLVQRSTVKFYILTESITQVLWLTLNRKLTIFKRTLKSHNDILFSDVKYIKQYIKQETKKYMHCKLQFRTMHTMNKITRTRESRLCGLGEVKFRLTDFPILYVKGKQMHRKKNYAIRYILKSTILIYCTGTPSLNCNFYPTIYSSLKIILSEISVLHNSKVVIRNVSKIEILKTPNN